MSQPRPPYDPSHLPRRDTGNSNSGDMAQIQRPPSFPSAGFLAHNDQRPVPGPQLPPLLGLPAQQRGAGGSARYVQLPPNGALSNSKRSIRTSGRTSHPGFASSFKQQSSITQKDVIRSTAFGSYPFSSVPVTARAQVVSQCLAKSTAIFQPPSGPASSR